MAALIGASGLKHDTREGRKHLPASVGLQAPIISRVFICMRLFEFKFRSENWLDLSCLSPLASTLTCFVNWHHFTRISLFQRRKAQ